VTRTLRTVIGLALIAVSALACCWAIYHLVRTGSCASGGVYVSKRECPPGTGGQIMALIGGIFGALIGAGVSPLRGSAGVAWGLTFSLFGVGAMVAAIGPAHPPGGAGLTIFGIAFGGFMILMGLGGFAGTLMMGRGVKAAQDAAQTFRASQRANVTTAGRKPMVSVQGGAMTPEQTARVTESLKSIGLGDVAGMVEDALEQSTTAMSAWQSQAAPARTPSAPSSPDDLTDELAKLAELHTSGALTDAEFEKAKSRLLGS
jgi:hypothetical protein